MKPIGLATNALVQQYLQKADGLDLVLAPINDSAQIPLFKNNSSYFLGGFKSFYTLVPDSNEQELQKYTEHVAAVAKNVECLISVPFPASRAKLVNYVLDLNQISDPEKRFDIYEKKTRNLVRKSYKNDLAVEIGKPPEKFYEVYAQSIGRLGGKIKSKEWFEMLETSLTKSIITFSLFDGDKLVASNYCITTEGYIFLMFNVSDQNYWEFSPNDRLYDELIKWAILSHKIRYVDFGPSTLSDDSHSHFKAGFGAKCWYLLTSRKGGLLWRLKAFWKQKRYNLALRFTRTKTPRATRQ